MGQASGCVAALIGITLLLGAAVAQVGASRMAVGSETASRVSAQPQRVCSDMALQPTYKPE